MNKKAIFIVESPLQVMCAFEAITYFDVTKPVLIIRLAEAGNNNPQIRNLVTTLHLDDYPIKYINLAPQSRKLKDYFKLLFLLFYNKIKSLGGYRIFVGYYDSLFARASSVLIPFSKITYLDDGTASLYYPQKLLGSQASFFSIFQLASTNYTENNFLNLSNFIGTSKIDDNQTKCLLFIGSPIREINICTFQEYIELLELVCDKYKELTFCYIPHRRELEADLAQYKSMGINVLRNSLPIEFFSYDFPQFYPEKTFTISSSAIFTLRKIYNCQIYVYAFSSKKNLRNDNYNKFIQEASKIGVLQTI